MAQIEIEIKELKAEVINMWMLVQSQLSKARNAIMLFDKDLARDVISQEKRVNAYELKIDRDCENIFALYTPVAVDLRFLLAVLKINNNLERIGDIAEGIARYVIDSPVAFNKTTLETSQLKTMYEDSVSILEDTMIAFEEEDTTLARTIFKRDEILNSINLNANKNVAALIRSDINFTDEALYILSIIRKLERVGDQCTNIAEEIIFYVEAKVLKHQKV
jgi:phosphate transport system protein